MVQLAIAQEQPTAFTGATIYPIEGAMIQGGTLLVQKGKILQVGDASLALPAGTVVSLSFNRGNKGG